MDTLLPANSPRESIYTAPASELQPPVVLVVDDEEQNRILLRFFLQSSDMHVLEANNGQQAMEMAQTHHPDVILMDLSMPMMDGFEATRQLKKLKSTESIPVVAVSAFCDAPDKHKAALEAGCLDCLEKPIQLAKVKSVVQSIVSNF